MWPQNPNFSEGTSAAWVQSHQGRWPLAHHCWHGKLFQHCLWQLEETPACPTAQWWAADYRVGFHPCNPRLQNDSSCLGGPNVAENRVYNGYIGTLCSHFGPGRRGYRYSYTSTHGELNTEAEDVAHSTLRISLGGKPQSTVSLIKMTPLALWPSAGQIRSGHSLAVVKWPPGPHLPHPAAPVNSLEAMWGRLAQDRFTPKRVSNQTPSHLWSKQPRLLNPTREAYSHEFLQVFLGKPHQEWYHHGHRQNTKKKVKSLSHVRLFATLWTVAYQAPPSVGFFRQEYWSGLPSPSPWVWVNSWSWWWTGRAGVLWFMVLQRVGHDWVTELNWIDIDNKLCGKVCINLSTE